MFVKISRLGVASLLKTMYLIKYQWESLSVKKFEILKNYFFWLKVHFRNFKERILN